MTERLLTKGLKYTGTVIEINPSADSFVSTKGDFAGQKKYCHYITLEVSGFPEAHRVQWCNDNETVTEFSKGDDIKFVVTGTNIGKGMHTIKFEQVAVSGIQKAAKTLALNSGVMGEQPDKFKDPGEKNSNPMVGGTLWSICLGNAVTFHKDRPKSTTADVIQTAQDFFEDFEKYNL